MTNYIAIIHKEKKSEFGVSFPDFPGCVTAGCTIDEAKDMASEALDLHIEGMREEGESVPAPSSLESIIANPEYKEADAILIVTSKAGEKVVRVNITLSEGELEQIDAAAKISSQTRSAFLVRAAFHTIRLQKQDDLSKNVGDRLDEYRSFLLAAQKNKEKSQKATR